MRQERSTIMLVLMLPRYLLLFRWMLVPSGNHIPKGHFVSSSSTPASCSNRFTRRQIDQIHPPLMVFPLQGMHADRSCFIDYVCMI